MTMFYWIGLIVGGGLLVISTVLGGEGDADLGSDGGVDVDIDADVDGDFGSVGSLTSWFSMNFAVYFLAAFGLVGVVMTYLTSRAPGTVVASSVIAGAVVGQGVHQLLRKLRSSSGNSAPAAADYENKLARVTVSVGHKNQGEIVVRVRRSDRYVPAVAKRDDDAFAPGEQVGVVAYRDGVAEVVSRKEFEFLTEES